MHGDAREMHESSRRAFSVQWLGLEMEEIPAIDQRGEAASELA